MRIFESSKISVQIRCLEQIIKSDKTIHISKS